MHPIDLDYKSRTILDSRGNFTSEVDIIYKKRVFRSSCPNGASVGSHECIVLTDNHSKYKGKSIDSVHQIIRNVILPHIKKSNLNLLNSLEIDDVLLEVDSSNNKQNVGVNSILPFSISFCKLSAHLNKLHLYEYISKIFGSQPRIPIPYFNVLNGGMHSGNNFSIQEIMVIFDTETIGSNIENASVFYQQLKISISKKYGSIFTSVGDEGGFTPPILSIDEAMDLLEETREMYTNIKYKVALDVAANSFYKDGKYNLNGSVLTTKQLCQYYLDLIKKYPKIYSIEDPFSEEDLNGWELFSKSAPPDLNIVGDDLTVTNSELIKIAGSRKLCNVLLVKPNQIGSVSETLKAVKMARDYGMKIMVSHRSGETEENFISDLSVGIGADYIKSGAPCRGERVSKYNQLLRIAEYLKK